MVERGCDNVVSAEECRTRPPVVVKRLSFQIWFSLSFLIYFWISVAFIPSSLQLRFELYVKPCDLCVGGCGGSAVPFDRGLAALSACPPL